MLTAQHPGTANPRLAAWLAGEPGCSQRGRSGAGSRVRRTTDAEGLRRAIQRVTYVAAWSWASFTLLDVYMARVLYPAAPVWRFLTLRAIEELVLIAVYKLSIRPSLSISIVIAAHNVSVVLLNIIVTLLALDFGGLNSAYIAGLSLALMARSALVPMRWQVALRALVPMTLCCPVIVTVACLVSPSLRQASLEPAILFSFASHYILVVASCIMGAVCSHVVWGAQRQLYQARKLGRYRLEAPIGEGGMGEIWLAWDDTLRRNVALKVLKPKDTPDNVSVQRFEREAYAVSKLASPHIVRIFDFGASNDGLYFIAMEYLRGMDLSVLVRHHGPLPIPRALHFTLQACQSLIEAHGAGIIHRDIKPQNLFICRVGDNHDFLKLLDFGIARIMPVEGGDADLTRTGVVCGTPAYMAPELCRGERGDARSDIYALGATLYFLLGGVPPFDGASAGQVIAAHLTRPVPPLLIDGPPQIAARVEKLVARCLAKDPADRYQTARDLGDAIQALADDTPWTLGDAQRFWLHEHQAKVVRWEATTLDGADMGERASAG